GLLQRSRPEAVVVCGLAVHRPQPGGLWGGRRPQWKTAPWLDVGSQEAVIRDEHRRAARHVGDRVREVPPGVLAGPGDNVVAAGATGLPAGQDELCEVTDVDVLDPGVGGATHHAS